MPFKSIDVDSVRARELVFVADASNSEHRYILQADTEDYIETWDRNGFPKTAIKRTTEFYIEDTDGLWFACYNVDCFDPPMAIIRARSFEHAYEVFCCEFERWMKVDDCDAADYPEDDRSYNDNGTHIDPCNVQIHPLTLLSILLETRS